MSCCVVFSFWMVPAVAQNVSKPSAFDSVRITALSRQEFHCHTGYSLPECLEDIRHLKSVLAHYPIEELGHWTWVLVRSEDWKRISRSLGLNPMSPAFTALEPRETFLEEALFVHDPGRTAELMHDWLRSMPQLLELAVSHELGHAFCAEPNEAAADHFAEQLRTGVAPRCGTPKYRNKSLTADRLRSH